MKKIIASYLPYNVKVVNNIDFQEFGLCENTVEELTGMAYEDVFTDMNEFNIKDCRLILRPLSELDKEIEHNGERFVPIIELSKLVDNGHNRINSQIHKSSNYITVLTGKCDDVENVRFQFTIEGISAIKRSGEAISFVTYDKIKRKILSWHFDVFGLIERGLAIDINELNKIK